MTQTDPAAPPNSVPSRVSLSNAKLTLTWHDREATFDASVLRPACRCAQCRFERHKADIADDAALPLADGIQIAISEVASMGYGLQVRFSDGHDRGIYPWTYLRELAAKMG